ncbi:ISAs1 family transposase [Aureivirga sp. CE67]|uniref:ISAs1 family transposase n=1 Tax=Aureivirga sp. CE67 TaxID=1788983 RepID=UPI0018C9A2B9|nr:ISAs1 family transposase [Aureivirga sp. CE67]
MQIKLSDFRDNRGKRHSLPFVILSFFTAFIRSTGHLTLSDIHRIMIHSHSDLIKDLEEFSFEKCVSYSQLRRILIAFDYTEFSEINFNYFRKTIMQEGKYWSSIDGKELRGSIDGVLGEKRGENIVTKVSHDDEQTEVIGFYSGKKESEKTVVKSYFENQQNISNKGFTLDALHTTIPLLTAIQSRKGTYLSQVKSNQKYLLEELEHISQHLPHHYTKSEINKEHGRIEKRTYKSYTINSECLSEKWKDTGIYTFIVVERDTLKLKTNQSTKETSFYISNTNNSKQNIFELFKACRNHWKVEAKNYVRDKTFGEDSFKSFNINLQRCFAVMLTQVINLLQRSKEKLNFKQIRTKLAYNKDELNKIFKSNLFL